MRHPTRHQLRYLSLNPPMAERDDETSRPFIDQRLETVVQFVRLPLGFGLGRCFPFGLFAFCPLAGFFGVSGIFGRNVTVSGCS